MELDVKFLHLSLSNNGKNSPSLLSWSTIQQLFELHADRQISKGKNITTMWEVNTGVELISYIFDITKF